MIHIEYARLHGWLWRWAAYRVDDNRQITHLAIAWTKDGARRELLKKIERGQP